LRIENYELRIKNLELDLGGSGMRFFGRPGIELRGVISTYKSGLEVPRISLPVEVKGRKYRELVFFAGSIIGRPKKEVKGLIYLDENDGVVTDKRLQSELSTTFAVIEELLDEGFIEKLSRTIKSEKNLAVEEAQSKFFEANLKHLSTRSIYGADIVLEIAKKLPELKKNNDAAVVNFINKAKEFENAEVIASTKVLMELKPLYTETLMKNYEKVKLIGTGRSYYEVVKKGAAKVFRSKIKGAFGSKIEGSAVTLDYELNHLMRIVKTYNLILDMSASEYLKYLRDMEKSQINEKNEKLRA
jgi:hypothetical protein